MYALVKARPGKGLELTKVPIPEVGYGEVLIRIRKTAICGTDLHIYNWDEWSQRHIVPPLTIGHEYVGVIEALGEGVEGLKAGQRVSGEGHITCGHCRNCRGGNARGCKTHRGSGRQPRRRIRPKPLPSAKNVVPIDEALPEEVVAFFDAYGNATHTAPAV
jgi:threonine 3-dehydrogenase